MLDHLLLRVDSAFDTGPTTSFYLWKKIIFPCQRKLEKNISPIQA